MSTGKNDGRLLVICGIDGSGKTLQSKRLHAKLQENGLPSRYIEFPRYNDGFFGNLIARYLRGEMADSAEEVNPYLASLPFACDRWEFSSQLIQWLENGDTVVCNRYVSANMAHQGAKIIAAHARDEFYCWVEQLEYGIFGIPKPYAHIWLDIMPEHALVLLGKKGERDYLQNNSDIHENLRHLQHARDAYAEIASRIPGSKRISCSGPAGPEQADDIEQKVWKHVTKILHLSEG